MRPFTLLFQPRRIWLPTLWGLVVMLLVLAVLATVFVRRAFDYLAPNQPAKEAHVLVVEGWLDTHELDQAVAAYRRGHYDRVLTTGGPIESWDGRREWKDYADRAARYLQRQGVPAVAVGAPASAQDRTFLSAVIVRDWLQAAGARPNAIDLYSGGVHARRSRLVYQLAFGGDVEVGVMSARPTDYDPERWWTTSQGAKTVMGEALGLAWTRCCFWPPPRGSHEERWAVPKNKGAEAP